MKQGNKLSILVIIDNRWWSGTSYYAVHTAKALSLRGHMVAVIGAPFSPTISVAEKLGLEVLKGFNPRETSLFKYNSELSRLTKIIRNGEFEILFPQGPSAHFWAVRTKRRLKGNVKVVRGLSDNMIPKSNLFNKRIFEKRTDAFIASCTSRVELYRSTFHIPEERFRVVTGPIDFESFDKDNEGVEEVTREENITFGVIARLSPVKGHETFIHAAGMVSEEIPECRFIISGEEDQINRNDLKGLAFRSGIGYRIEFYDKFPSSAEAISRVDVGVVPSNYSEVVCRVAMEFMAAGKPVICSDANSLPEIVRDGVSGIIFPAGDDKALAKAMIRIAEDEEMRKRMGDFGRKRVESYLGLMPFGEGVEKFLQYVNQT